MIQITIILIGFLGLSHMMSTTEDRDAARQSVKRLEPYCWTIIIGGIGLVGYGLAIG